MICRGRAALDTKSRGSGPRELLGVNAGDQAKGAACCKHPPAVLDAKGAAVTEAVDELRQFLLDHGWNQPAYDFFNVVGGAAPEAIRKCMNRQKCGYQLQRRISLQPSNDAENLHFLGNLETIAALHLRGGGSMFGEAAEEFPRLFRQR